MKKLFIKIILFNFLLFITIYTIFMQVDGYTDPYYKKFTTPEQSSLILGNSKAAQGLQPQIFNKTLSRNDLFNYSFTISSSPYGPLYLESVKRKLNQETKDGIFILTVDVWSLSSNTENPNDSSSFSELDLFLNNNFVNMNPNIPYLINYFDKKFINIFWSKKSSLYLHENGWLEVDISIDSIMIHKRIERNVDFYTKNYLPKWKYSDVRYKYLSKTIAFLKQFGTVFLVRLPVHEKIRVLESQIFSGIDEKINDLIKLHNIEYFNFADSSGKYLFTDGFHLYKESGEKISEQIAKLIIEKIDK